MSTYKEIVGKKIKRVTSDPSNSIDGQMWYNSTTGSIRGLALSESWAAGNSILTGRYNLAGSGTQTAGLIAGGTTPGIVTNTEHFDGIGWRNGGTLIVGRDSATMFGLSTAATFVGGYAPSPNGFRALVEEYNGTAWAEETDMPAPRAQGASAGIQTDGIVFGGNQGPPGSPETTATTTLEYNGSSWTTGGAMSVNDRYIMGCGGSQAEALRIGGESDTDATEEYNGSAWTTGGNLNTGRYQAAASGTNTAGLVFGGNPNRTNTEGYDGTSWSNKPALATGVEDTSGSAQGTNAEAFQAGQSASPTSIVQNWNSSTNIITAAAWASGGTVPYASRQNMSFGTQTAAIACGGHPPGNLNTSVSYDGTSYSSTPNLNAAARIGGVAGTQSAGLEYGGIQPPGTYVANMQSWNGSSWSNSPYNLNNGTYGMMSCGTSTAALSAGGENPSGGDAWNITEEYDGGAWTSGNTMPVARYYGGGDGTQTSAFIAGGSGPVSPTSLEYDGTNWTAGGSLISPTGAGSAGSGENSDSGLIFGGSPPGSGTAITQGYDGTAWSTRPSLGTGRGFTTGNGTATAGLMVSGGPPSGTTTATEEFTGSTETANITNFTTS